MALSSVGFVRASAGFVLVERVIARLSSLRYAACMMRVFKKFAEVKPSGKESLNMEGTDK